MFSGCPGRGEENGIKIYNSRFALQLRYNDARQQRVYLNGEDVSDQIRTPAVSMAASQVGSISEVREFLLSQNTDIALTARPAGKACSGPASPARQ